MLPSLRLRLVLGFTFVIAFTLLFASLGSVLLLRDQQTEFAQQRFGRLVDPFAARVQQLELVGVPLSRIRAELVDAARYYDVRVLLVNENDQVVVDTAAGQSLVGLSVDVTDDSPDVIDLPGVMEPFRARRAVWHDEDLFVFTSANPTLVAQDGGGLQPLMRLVVAVPASDVNDAWAALLPRQALAGGLALLFAVMVSSWLASRITRPLRQMTHASEAMIEGRYDQRIDVEGYDEVAQLGNAFNRMATEVGRSQRAMRQLVANITHDLKTPLTSIQGFSQAIMDGLSSDPEEHRRMAQVIHEEAEHMNGLVEDLLYLSRIDAGELTLAINDVDLDALVAATSRRTRYQAESGGVRVRLALDGGRVYADGRRLEQVFTNLVDNAIRFAPSGSEVLLRSYVDGSDAVVEVHNGGKPIPANALPHVFDRFFQGDPSRRRGHAGLGLAIVQELVQAHGGKVEVQSSADSGTTFTVRLRRLGPPGFAVPREAKPDGPPVSTEALARG